MVSQKYPIGIQTFSEIIEKGYSYIDKTRYIAMLEEEGKYIFLSRPRRFGKSLLVSTMEAYFEGRRDLFKGLDLYDMVEDWMPSPVLHFDFNAENYRMEDGLERIMDTLLTGYEKIYGREPKFVTPAQRLRHLIEAAYAQTHRQVVILMDEYDKPLLLTEDNEPLQEKNQMILKSFCGCLKTMDRYIRFAFITGVARFSNVSIFSDINNLDDISLSEKYADICGWDEKELTSTFSPSIRQLAEKRKEDFEETLLTLRRYYDGYLFAPEGSRLYNPYSVLRAFKAEAIKPYWFETGTPTFLARWVKSNDFNPESLNGAMATEEDLTAVGFDRHNPIPMMFQTGYLTIWRYDALSELYELRFPNREVEIGFYKKLLPLYAPTTARSGNPLEFPYFKKDLAEGKINDFMERLAILLKGLPGTDHCESTYRATTYLLCMLCGTEVTAENQSYKGRSDLEALTPNYIYIFEFKYNRSVSEAMNQIHSRDYAGRYALDHRPVYLIAANFDERKDRRKLSYEIELLPKSSY